MCVKFGVRLQYDTPVVPLGHPKKSLDLVEDYVDFQVSQFDPVTVGVIDGQVWFHIIES